MRAKKRANKKPYAQVTRPVYDPSTVDRDVDQPFYFSKGMLPVLGTSLLVAILLVAPVAALLFGVFEAGFGNVASETRGIRMSAADVEGLRSARATQQAGLEAYRWVHQGEPNVVRLPVERAMEVVVEGGQPFGGLTLPEAPLAAGALPGEAVFTGLGCNACHQAQDNPTAPTLVGLFGAEEQLEGGETVVADEEYIRESILDPHAQLVAGYGPIMPSFAGQLDDQELTDLIEYIRSLGEPAGAPAEGGG